MKKRNKLLIRLLTAVLCISLLPVTVMAAPDEGDIPFENNLQVVAEGYGTSYVEIGCSMGERKTLEVSVSANDEDGITYQWTYTPWGSAGGDDIVLDSTSNTCTAPAYSEKCFIVCSVSDKYGNSESVVFSLFFDNQFSARAAGSEDPYPTSINYFVAPGASQELSVIANANDASGITYQWMIQGEYDGSGVSEFNLPNGNESSYTIESVTKRATYVCNVQDSVSNMSIRVFFYVYVDNNLSVSIDGYGEGNWIQETYDIGDAATFTLITTADDTEGITYEWRVDGVVVEGATTNVFTIPEVTGKAWVDCTVRDKYGNVQSATIDLIVNNNLKAWPTDAENTESNSITYTVSPGSTKQLSVFASSGDPSGITYQWSEQMETPDGWSESNIPGATEATYTVERINSRKDYVCTVSDSVGGTYVRVFFHVYIDNNLSISIDGYGDSNYIQQAYDIGDTATFSVVATAYDTEGITYEWRMDGKAVEDATTNVFTIPEVSGKARLECKVRDKYGNTQYAYIDLEINNDFKAWPADADDQNSNSTYYYLAPGSTKQLEVAVSAKDTSEITYQWYEQGWSDEGWPEWKLEGETGNTYTPESISAQKTYMCDVYDKVSGMWTRVFFYLYVTNSLTATFDGCEDYNFSFMVDKGDTKTLKVIASAEDTSEITYKWYWNGQEVSGQNTDTFTTEAIKSYSYGSCEISDQYGNSYTLYFSVYPDNQFEVWSECPTVVNFDPDSPNILSVCASAIDESGITYQWKKYSETDQEYMVIPGADEASYTVEECGEYRCEVYDPICGMTNSIDYSVIVDNQFKLSAVGYSKKSNSIRIVPGTTKTLQVKATASDLEGVRYSWFYNGEQQDATGDTWTTPQVFENCSVFVTCWAYDKYGNGDSVDFFVYANNYLSAWETGADSEGPEYTKLVAPGSFLTLSVSSDWPGDLEYTWYKMDQRNTEPYNEWFSNSELVEGATGSTLIAGPVNENTVYYCEVSNGANSSATVYFDIYVNHPFSAWVTNEEEGWTYTEIEIARGGSAELSASVKPADSEDLQFAWYRETDDGQVEKIAGAEGRQYTVENVQGNVFYYCAVTDQYNNLIILAYLLEVSGGFDAWVANSTEHYHNAAILYDENADTVLSVASNDDNATYTWYYSGEFGTESKEPVSGVGNSQTMTIPAGEEPYPFYLCKVTDPYGNYQYVEFAVKYDLYAWATLAGEDILWDYNHNIQAEVGDTKVLEVSVLTNSEKVYYQWYKENDYDGGDFLLEGETGDTLTLENILHEDTYYCVVTDQAGNEARVGFWINCNPVWITGSDPHNTMESISIKRGDPFALSVDVANGLEDYVSYSWYVQEVDENGYTYDRPIEGADSCSIQVVSFDKPMELWCKVSFNDGFEQYVYFDLDYDMSDVEPVTILGSSLTLDGYLKIKLGFNLPDDFLSETGAYLMINEKKYTVDDASPKDGKYYFSYALASTEVMKSVKVQAFYPDGTEYPLFSPSGIDYTDGFNYSIMQYVAMVENMSDEKLATYTDKPAELRLLLTRLDEYGTLSQAYFKDNDSRGSISDSELEQVDAVKSSDPDLERHKATITKAQNCGIKYSGNLSLETATHLNHYFTLEAGRSIDEYEIRVNGDLITTESTGAITLKLVSGNKYCLKIDNIAAPDLDEGYDISVVDTVANETVISVEGFSALSYIYLYLKTYENDTSKTDIVRVLKSLYLYNQAANGFFG